MSSFDAIFEAAVVQYTNQTGKNLNCHPLASSFNACDSVESVLAVFQEQVQAFGQFRNGNHKLIQWLRPIVSGLYDLSTCPALSTGLSLAFPPATAIFCGVSVLLSSVRGSYDALIEVFECIENFLRRLMIYTKFDQPSPAMTEVVIKIMAELISVLAVATKQMNQGPFKKYGKKFLGEREIESVLQRLDRLTLEESRTTVAQTLDVLYGLSKNIQIVMEGGQASIGDIRQTLVLMQKVAMEVNRMERDQLQEKFQRWLSPPDPWTNYNIAHDIRHRDTSMWFTQGDVMKTWKSTGSLLWVNGLPGSGKTIISSSIIDDIQDMCQTGLAILSIFYCDFRDANKQNARNLLSSLLIQLCRQSDAFSQVLSLVYSTHDNGSRQPSLDALLECLKSMLKLPAQGEIYLVIDAIDECPNSAGCPTPREQVLIALRQLIDLKFLHVHFCITSRPEIDIRGVLEPLAIYSAPLHEQAGQNQDIVDYIKDFILLDPRMRQWREEDKQLVVETLTRKAGGMFRWVHFQIEALRFCYPPSIRRVLDELPETLDGTYERTLLGINKHARDYARCLLQCLVISIRPLRVEELAELFAIPSDSDTTPEFNIAWRPEDPEAFILSTCSTLVDIVHIKGNKVVQFSHFSVREYLTSDRIANSTPVSHFHVLPKPAHTLLARACLSVLSQLDHTIDKTNIHNFPLASYAAEHWVNHARFKDVSSDIRDGMDCLFNKNKPHLAAWIWLYDVENSERRYCPPPSPTRPDAVPLYYAALCGFRDLAERLLDAHPQDLHAQGGYYETPLHAAINKGYLSVVLLLLERGADVESQDRHGRTAIYTASSLGYAEVVQSLIAWKADLNVAYNDWEGILNKVRRTPLLVASRNGRLECARVLLEHGAAVNGRDDHGMSPLHLASRHPSNELARLLLNHCADVNASDARGNTALHEASHFGQIMVVMLLLEQGADVDAQNNWGSTPLHHAANDGHLGVVQLLLDHSANVNAPKENLWTPLHIAAYWGHLHVVEVLLERGADPDSLTNEGMTPLQLASRSNRTQIMRLLSGHTQAGEAT